MPLPCSGRCCVCLLALPPPTCLPGVDAGMTVAVHASRQLPRAARLNQPPCMHLTGVGSTGTAMPWALWRAAAAWRARCVGSFYAGDGAAALLRRAPAHSWMCTAWPSRDNLAWAPQRAGAITMQQQSLRSSSTLCQWPSCSVSGHVRRWRFMSPAQPNALLAATVLAPGRDRKSVV